jgi:hypothetical protein
MSFSREFAAARKAGKGSFSYKGKLYHTRTAEEEAARKKSPPLPPKRPETPAPAKTASAPTPPKRPADLGQKAASTPARPTQGRSPRAAGAEEGNTSRAPVQPRPAAKPASAPASGTRSDTVGTPRSQRPSQASTKGNAATAPARARTAAMHRAVENGPKTADLIEKLRRTFGIRINGK